MTYLGPRIIGNFKPPKASKNRARLKAIRGLPCVICYAYGEPQNSPTQAHHAIHGRYSTAKASDDETIPLCEGHHQGDFDTTKLALHRDKAEWARVYGEDHEFIALTNDMLAGELNK